MADCEIDNKMKKRSSAVHRSAAACRQIGNLPHERRACFAERSTGKIFGRESGRVAESAGFCPPARRPRGRVFAPDKDSGNRACPPADALHLYGALLMRWIIMSAGVVLVAASLARAFDEPKKKPPAKESPPAKERSEKSADKKDTGKKDAVKKEVDKKDAGNKDAEKEKSAKSVAEQIQAVQTELNEQQQKLVKEYRSAKDDEARNNIVEQFNKLQVDVVEKYLAIVKNNKPDDKELFPALVALVGMGQQTELAVDLLVKHHVDNP